MPGKVDWMGYRVVSRQLTGDCYKIALVDIAANVMVLLCRRRCPQVHAHYSFEYSFKVRNYYLQPTIIASIYAVRRFKSCKLK